MTSNNPWQDMRFEAEKLSEIKTQIAYDLSQGYECSGVMTPVPFEPGSGNLSDVLNYWKTLKKIEYNS